MTVSVDDSTEGGTCVATCNIDGSKTDPSLDITIPGKKGINVFGSTQKNTATCAWSGNKVVKFSGLDAGSYTVKCQSGTVSKTAVCTIVQGR